VHLFVDFVAHLLCNVLLLLSHPLSHSLEIDRLRFTMRKRSHLALHVSLSRSCRLLTHIHLSIPLDCFIELGAILGKFFKVILANCILKNHVVGLDNFIQFFLLVLLGYHLVARGRVNSTTRAAIFYYRGA